MASHGGLSPKTIDNCLTVLRRMLVVARTRGLIDRVPEVEWLKAERPELDLLDFEAADRLVAAADEEALRRQVSPGRILRTASASYVASDRSGRPEHVD